MHIVAAVVKSIPSIFTSIFFKKLVQCVFLTFACLMVFIWLVGYITDATSLFETPWLESAFDWISFGASTILAWFLFPSLLPLIAGLFQGKLLNALEQRHYNMDEKKKDFSRIRADILFALKSIAINLLILPSLLIAPLYFILYCITNGYLLGTEFFRVVTDRRIDREKSNALISKHRLSVYGTGCLIALCMLVPIANLIIPLLAVIVMMHLFYLIKDAK